LQDVRDLLRRRRGINGDEYRTCGLRTERGGGPLHTVLRVDRDAVAGLEPMLDEPTRHAANLRRELPPRHRLPAVAVANLESHAIAMRREPIEYGTRCGRDLEQVRDVHG